MRLTGALSPAIKEDGRSVSLDKEGMEGASVGLVEAIVGVVEASVGVVEANVGVGGKVLCLSSFGKWLGVVLGWWGIVLGYWGGVVFIYCWDVALECIKTKTKHNPETPLPIHAYICD